MLPDQSEFHYQMKFRREQILRDLEQNRLRRIALEARRQKTPRRSFSLSRWLRQWQSNGVIRFDKKPPLRRPMESEVV